ncbi:hypothetical protein [Sphingobacterium sp.]|uniref:hypothetical protein n=1 Tax=Sphingobacterium sp. TaxID=341027 RepID=UPI0031E40778
MNDTLNFLTDVRDRLEYISYDQIYQAIVDMRDKFVPTAIIKKGAYIDRVRVHKKTTDVFSREEDVSYIHDKEIIKNFIGFGRANKEKQAIFYGAVESPKIKQPRIVAYFETSPILKELEKYHNISELFTVSRWRVLKDIEVVEMIFSDEALKVSNYTKISLEHQMQYYQHLLLAKEYEEQGRFFSNEFARSDVRPGEDHKYKITSAYANFIWANTNLKGITYPSVQSAYLGQNVALLPEVVDTSLRLESPVGIFKFERIDGVNQPVDCTHIAMDLGENNSAFVWQDYKAEKLE